MGRMVMKIFLTLFGFLIIVNINAQNTSYSEEEIGFVPYARTQFWESRKFNSESQYIAIRDSCYKFLEKYPNSFAKPNVFAVLLDLLKYHSADKGEIEIIADSLLVYDHLPATKVRVAEALIDKSINVEKGMRILDESIPELSTNNQLIQALLLKSDVNIQLGKLTEAKQNIENAIEVDSTRLELWYKYLSIEIKIGAAETVSTIENRIKSLEDDNLRKYKNTEVASNNIGKNIFEYSGQNLDGNIVHLSELAGKVNVINFFGFWCGTCISEFPILLEFQKQFPYVNLVFITDKFFSADEIKNRYLQLDQFSFLKKQHLLIGDIRRKLDVKAVPYTIVVDKNGFIKYHYLGYDSELGNLLSENVKELL